MKIMVRSLAVIFMAFLTTGLFAQQGPPAGGMRNQDPEENAKRQVETMKGDYQAGCQGRGKGKRGLLNAAKEQQKAFQSAGQGGDREQMRAKMQEMNKKRDAELEKIIGKEKMEKYLKEIEKRRQERSGSRGRGN
ncbi:MAG: hypothetical protein R2727_04645 [Bacteroidales bacterium]